MILDIAPATVQNHHFTQGLPPPQNKGLSCGSIPFPVPCFGVSMLDPVEPRNRGLFSSAQMGRKSTRVHPQNISPGKCSGRRVLSLFSLNKGCAHKSARGLLTKSRKSRKSRQSRKSRKSAVWAWWHLCVLRVRCVVQAGTSSIPCSA